MKNRFVKIIPLLLLCVILFTSLSGCSSSTTSAPSVSTPATSSTPTTPATTVSPAPTTRVITDMYGTNITIPSVINRIIATGPVETQLLYILAPEKLAGISIAWDGSPALIPAQYKNITVIGNSSSGTFNYETAISVKPDVVLEGKTKNLPTDREKFGNIPVIGVDAGADLLTMYEKEIKFVADLLGVQDRGQKLLDYYDTAMAYVNSVVSKIKDGDKVHIYYAEGSDGLQTDAQGSWHTNLLTYCGGVNVAKVQVSNTSQAVQVSLEQIYSWDSNPPIDMIIIGRSSQSVTYNAIMNSADWQRMTCVKEGRVYVRPDNPTSLFDGPPGYGQILGMYWMVHLLYPDKTRDLDLNAKVKEFYADFLHYNLTDIDVAQLLTNAG